MIAPPEGFLGVFAIAIIIAIVCDSESKPIPVETPLTAVAPTSDCPGCLTRERVASAQPGDTIEIAAGVYTMPEGSW